MGKKFLRFRTLESFTVFHISSVGVKIYIDLNTRTVFEGLRYIVPHKSTVCTFIVIII